MPSLPGCDPCLCKAPPHSSSLAFLSNVTRMKGRHWVILSTLFRGWGWGGVGWGVTCALEQHCTFLTECLENLRTLQNFLQFLTLVTTAVRSHTTTNNTHLDTEMEHTFYNPDNCVSITVGGVLQSLCECRLVLRLSVIFAEMHLLPLHPSSACFVLPPQNG